MDTLSAEFLAIITAALALGGLVTAQTHAIRTDLCEAQRERADLAQRVARLEGVLATLQAILLDRTDKDAA